MFTEVLFFLNPVPWPSALRVILLRMFGAKVGSGVVVRTGVRITFPWRLSIGSHVWIGEEVLILSLAPVIIGSNVCISQRTFLCTGSHDFRSPKFDLITKAINLEDRTWVAAQAFVGPGVTVHSGAVVAGGAVVMEDVPANVLVVGNPGKIVKIIERPTDT